MNRNERRLARKTVEKRTGIPLSELPQKLVHFPEVGGRILWGRWSGIVTEIHMRSGVVVGWTVKVDDPQNAPTPDPYQVVFRWNGRGEEIEFAEELAA